MRWSPPSPSPKGLLFIFALTLDLHRNALAPRDDSRWPLPESTPATLPLLALLMPPFQPFQLSAELSTHEADVRIDLFARS